MIQFQTKLLNVILISCIFNFVFPLHAKVLLFTYSYNKPEFIELQYKTFNKFLLDDYELIVINDANNLEMQNQIMETCTRYNLRCINIPQEIHQRPYLDRPKGPFVLSNHNSANARNCNVVQYSLDILGFSHSDIIALFDSDIFLIKEFSITEYLQGFDLAGYDRLDFSLPRKSKSFLWIGLIFLKTNALLLKESFNVNCGYIGASIVDSGGYSNYYLEFIQPKIHYFEKIMVEDFICEPCKQEKNYRCKHNTKILKNKGLDDNLIRFIQDTPIDWGSGSSIIGMAAGRNLEFFLDNTFVHYQGASNYAPLSTLGIDMAQFHLDKTNAFKAYINIILNM